MLFRSFVTAFDVTPAQQVKIQAAFQRWTDNAVSKTINLPREASEKDIRDIYFLANRLRCKGITVYRYGSKKGQVLSFPKKFIQAESGYSGGCANRECVF